LLGGTEENDETPQDTWDLLNMKQMCCPPGHNIYLVEMSAGLQVFTALVKTVLVF